MSFCSAYMTTLAWLHNVGSVDTTAEQKTGIGKLTPRNSTPFAGRQPSEHSHWNTEPSGPWKPVSPRLVIEVRYAVIVKPGALRSWRAE